MLKNKVVSCGSDQERPPSVVYDNFAEINFSSEIEDFSVHNFIESIYQVSHELSRFEVAKGSEIGIGIHQIPIVVQFSTFGGDVMQAMRIINLVRNSERNIIFVANSVVASVGVYIFLSAKKSNRFVTHSSFFVMHDFIVSHSHPVGSKDIVNNLDNQYKVLKKIFENEFIKNINLKKKIIGSGAHKDLYITAEDSIKYNISDGFFEGNRKTFSRFGLDYDFLKREFYSFMMGLDK